MNPSRLFLASCMALIVTAMSFAIRGDTSDEIAKLFILSLEQVGWINGTAFWGFTLAMVFGGPLCDVIGMKRIILIAMIGHLAGIIVTIFANGFWSLYMGTLLIGIANGSVEAACNPLIATLYPDEKTKRLNFFHVWFPGGIVIGGLTCFALANAGLGWQAKNVTMLLPLAIYAALFFGQSFPRTERVESGISTGDMFRACLNPFFLLLVFCMVLTAATELGPNQWITDILKKSVGNNSILVLVWITGLMALGRQFAGPVVHRLNPVGMLLFSAIFSAIGLMWISIAADTYSLYAAATVFAVGVCYFWPTMLGLTAERCPRTGALGLAIMGGAGMLSVSFVLPLMGHVYDQRGGDVALRLAGCMPFLLIGIFGILWAADRRRGGYKAEKI
ncbi:MAG: sugar MFS transporter [Candidatus Methylacidiphilales bacterium]|nr:MFS transporter [Candidatus Methylacidiphilales bacterium]